jgi:hypothetical protein
LLEELLISKYSNFWGCRPDVSLGHQVRIRRSDFYDRFQIAVVPDSDQIGKFRHFADLGIDDIFEVLPNNLLLFGN